MQMQHLMAATSLAALALLSTAARAGDDASRPMTRDEVVAQVLAARASGELAALATGGTWNPAAPESKLTREEVAAQVLAARQSGELAAISTGAEWASPTQPAPASQVRRDDVIKEFLATRHATSAIDMERSL